jgi:hypothetical protein
VCDDSANVLKKANAPTSSEQHKESFNRSGGWARNQKAKSLAAARLAQPFVGGFDERSIGHRALNECLNPMTTNTRPGGGHENV